MLSFRKNQQFGPKSKLLLCPCFHYIPSFKKNSECGKEKKLFLPLQKKFFLFLIFAFLLIVFIYQPDNHNYHYNYYKGYDPDSDIIVLPFVEESVVSEEEIDWSLFSLAWNRVQENFIYFDEINKDKMNAAIMETIANFDNNQVDEKEINIAVIKTMIDQLNCPFSRFQIAPYPQAIIREIGITIEKRGEKITIIDVEKGSPAENKIIVGDQLIFINDKDIKNLELWEITKKLIGEAGIEVKLSILRIGYDNLKIFRIIRREVKELPPIVPPTVRWELKEDNIAYVQIFQFMDGLYLDFYLVVKEILESPANKIILDLRNNPGGDLGMVKRVSEYFLKQDNLILIEKRPGKRIEHRSQRTGELSEMKIMVLINNNSISGAEIMAATLKDNREAILIGEKSFGKASVQRGFHLKERYSIIITTDTWLTPQGKSINIVGITPDHLIANPDQQLNKALDLLN